MKNKTSTTPLRKISYPDRVWNFFGKAVILMVCKFFLGETHFCFYYLKKNFLNINLLFFDP